jgi:hypothetical protein
LVTVIVTDLAAGYEKLGDRTRAAEFGGPEAGPTQAIS